jgi:hypothetical protein
MDVMMMVIMSSVFQNVSKKLVRITAITLALTDKPL